MLGPQAVKKSIDLKIDVAMDTRLGILDPGMFRQILVNLLSNAVKFTPGGGRVRVRTRRSENDLVVYVEDNGIGIEAAHAEKVFTEFYQVDDSYSRHCEGTGLGLALVRRMVELLGGTISVDSTPGQGSTFTCTFRGRALDVAAAEDPRFEPLRPRAA